MINIIVEIDPDLTGIDKQKSIHILTSTLKQEQISNAKINLIFAKDNLLNKLKIEYFQKDHLTDVIAFRINDYTDKEVEGEIYISLERAVDNAKEYEEKVSKELARLIIHGTLHLLNYKDNTDKEKLTMTRLENKYLKNFNWSKIFKNYE
ncbi:MAG: rRNA maturation RNase YbeY [Candidatus Marinimicrobia bacterium]|nr:rRNA maturation RNase YbeY [Candidatus Neomarinimicrobiota bacterium]